MASSSIISPYPDFTSLALVLGVAQIVNIKPHAPVRESSDLSSNAYASFLYVCRTDTSFAVVISLFIALRKVWFLPAHPDGRPRMNARSM